MFNIQRLEICEVLIPFRFKYKHAKTVHDGVSLIVCVAYDNLNRIGLGEAVPRVYVTGETSETVVEDIKKLSNILLKENAGLDSFKREILSLAESWQGRFPSCALCALEGAMLDLYAQDQQKSLAGLFNDGYLTNATYCHSRAGGNLQTDCLDPRLREDDIGCKKVNNDKLSSSLKYTGSIGISKPSILTLKLLAYKLAGFESFKIKVGVPGDIARVKMVRKILGEDVRLYADANAVWDRETAVKQIEALRKHNVWAIEEPLKPPVLEGERFEVLNEEHYQNYVWLKERISLPIIADESLISLATLDKIIKYKAFDIINVRLSKCGGFILSNEMVKRAQANQMKFGIGAMVGETPILAVEGANLGAANPGHEFIQGFSHDLLHGVCFPTSSVRIKKGGSVTLGDNHGLGVQFRVKQLEKVLIRKEVVQL